MAWYWWIYFIVLALELTMRISTALNIKKKSTSYVLAFLLSGIVASVFWPVYYTLYYGMKILKFTVKAGKERGENI